MAAADELVFVALGGVGEIGMNLALYGYGRGRSRKWLAVDLGVAFGLGDELPGVDGVLPDIRYLVERKADLVGIAISHAHEDHYGALLDFWPQLQAPVFMTPFAAALLEAKRAGEQNAPKIPVTVVRPRQPFQVGPFEVEYVSVSHSIPESNALAIRTPAGTVIHTGDWKLDPAPGIGPATDSDRLAALGEEGVLALVSDSTNAIRDGVSPSEGRGREGAGAPHRRGAAAGGGDDLRLERGAHPRRGRGRAPRRPRRRGRRPRHPPLRRCRARARLSGGPAGIPRPGDLCAAAAQQGGGADDGEPGRAARGARQDRRRRIRARSRSRRATG